MPATLLDTLSTDTLSIIVKRVASQYYSRANGTADALGPFFQLLLLFLESSPFRRAAATLVSEIKLSWYGATFVDSDLAQIFVGPELFKGEAKEMGLAKLIFSVCGPDVRKIVVSEVREEVERAKDFVEQFKSHVFQNCRNVEQVAFHEYGVPLTKWGTATSFFREYGANLRLIDWNGDEDENSFSDIRKCSNLRRLKSRKLNTGTLVSLLKACGSTLEETDVSIEPVRDSMEVMEAIQNQCSELSVINIWNLDDVMDIVGQESYAKLIRSYGPKLKHAETYVLDHEHLVEVVKSCPNLEVCVNGLEDAGVDWQHVSALGPRVVYLHFNSDELYGDGYPGVFKQCWNLRRLKISGIHRNGSAGVSEEMIANVFSSSRFPKLEELFITNFWANLRNMRLISSCTANLKHACFLPFRWDFKVSTFQIIADSSRHLNSIDINIYSYHEPPQSAETALESLGELVKVFRKCRSLILGMRCSLLGKVWQEDLIHIAKVLPCRDMRVFLQIEDVYHTYTK